MNEHRTNRAITGYASVLNAAHLLAEESAHKLHELAERYPDAIPAEVVQRALSQVTQSRQTPSPEALRQIAEDSF